MAFNELAPSDTRLPSELLERICVEAALDSRHTAYALAFTSKAICHWTKEERLKTVAITNVRQFLSFWRVISGVRSTVIHELSVKLVDEGKLTSDFLSRLDNLSHLDEEDGALLSLPSPNPGAYVRHFFIEIKPCNHRLELYRILRAMHTSLARIVPPFSLEHLLPLETLALGDEDAIHLVPLIKNVPGKGTTKELTLVTRSDNHAESVLKCLENAGVQVNKLHLIGVDPDSPRAGVPFPSRTVEFFRQGSVERLDRSVASEKKSVSVSLSHIRYDSRKFSFKPAEITAMRMKTFFQEIAMPHEVGRKRGNQLETEPTFRHTEPRHAAPLLGSGNRYLARQTYGAPSSVPVQEVDCPVAHKLEELGVGGFELLHLAWDPINDLREHHVPWYRRSRFSMDENDGEIASAQSGSNGNDPHALAGGWPKEKLGAWTERSDRDLASSFAVEIRDSINSLYGWDAPGIQAAGKYQATKRGTKDDFVNLFPGQISQHSNEGRAIKMHNIGFVREQAGDTVGRVKHGFDAGRPNADVMRTLEEHLRDLLLREGNDSVHIPELRVECRAPRSFIHLGGQAALELEDRLALFEDRARGGKGAWL